MPSTTTTGIVLYRTDTGEYDRILTVYTLDSGKISCIARGARKASSKFSGLTEPFTLATMHLATGRSFFIVTQAEIKNAYTALRNDIQRLARAVYFCDLLDHTTAYHDNSNSTALLALITHALQLLAQPNPYLDGVVHAFEIHLLAAQGYAPALDNCVVCGTSESRNFGFSPNLGGLVCSADRFRTEDALPLSSDALDTLRILEAGDTKSILSLQPDLKLRSDVAKVMRWFLRAKIESNLKSADFLDNLRGTTEVLSHKDG